jgi:hypothetical protein
LIKREKSKRFAVIITFFLWFGFGTDAERRARGVHQNPHGPPPGAKPQFARPTGT